jgi:preprotein translocase subunit SecA
MDTLGVEDDLPLESGMVSRQIEAAQVKVEGYNFDLRKHLLEYDEVINEQRRIIYEQRSEVLRRDDLRPIIWDMVEGEIHALVDTYTVPGRPEDWDVHALATATRAVFPLPPDEDPDEWTSWSVDELREHLLAEAEEAYDEKAERLGPEMMHQVERAVTLRVIDQWWVRHLTALDELRTGIGLVAYGQQDPLVTFKRRGYDMFQELLGKITADVARGVFHAELVSAAESRRPVLDRATAGRGRLIDQAMAATTSAAQTVRVGTKLGRNDPCHCGSGRKYKLCHMKSDLAAGIAPPGAAAGAAPGREHGDGKAGKQKAGGRRK